MPAAAAVFGAGGAFEGVAGTSVLLLAALLVGPLLLHVGTATLTAWGAGQGKRTFALCFLLAVFVHTAYNLAVTTYGGAMLR